MTTNPQTLINPKALNEAAKIYYDGSYCGRPVQHLKDILQAYLSATEQPHVQCEILVQQDKLAVNEVRDMKLRIEMETRRSLLRQGIEFGVSASDIATDVYEKLKPYLSLPEREYGWVDVKDELPRHYIDVLVWRPSSNFRPIISRITDIKEFRKTGEWFNGIEKEEYVGFHMDWEAYGVTHWIPLPPTPTRVEVGSSE